MISVLVHGSLVGGYRVDRGVARRAVMIERIGGIMQCYYWGLTGSCRDRTRLNREFILKPLL